MTANTLLWALSLLLEGLLLAVLIRRGTARLLPVFTALIAFYVLRSVLLFALFGHLDAPAYELTYTTLSSIDLLLQIAVAGELFAGDRQRTQPPLPRPALFAGLVLLSAAVAWLLSVALPGSARNPVDRGVLFTSSLMLAVFAFARDRFAGTFSRRVLQGFAVLGIAGILTQIGRTVAALHRDAHAFTRWSWAEPGAYLAVLVFWLLAFNAQRAAASLSPHAVEAAYLLPD